MEKRPGGGRGLDLKYWKEINQNVNSLKTIHSCLPLGGDIWGGFSSYFYFPVIFTGWCFKLKAFIHSPSIHGLPSTGLCWNVEEDKGPCSQEEINQEGVKGGGSGDQS